VDGTGSRLCAVVGFCISGVEPLCSAATTFIVRGCVEMFKTKKGSTATTFILKCATWMLSSATWQHLGLAVLVAALLRTEGMELPTSCINTGS